MSPAKLFGTLVIAITLTTSAAFAVSDKKDDAETEASSEQQQEATVTLSTENSFDEAKDNVEMAITGRGLLISSTLHVSDMLNRTGKDLGFDKAVFKHAEGLEFCSSLISHKMAEVHPSNIALCPFTVVIYELENEPGKTYLSYQVPQLQGDGGTVETEIRELLHGIAEEGSE